MNAGLALLDVNVAMYAAGRAHPYKEPCGWVMTEIAEGRLAAAVDTEIIQEILYRYGALQQWSVAVTLARSLLEIVPTVFPVLPADAGLAIELFDEYGPRGVSARDALHAAVMRSNAVAQIISADLHFDLIAGITRLDPRTLFESARGQRT